MKNLDSLQKFPQSQNIENAKSFKTAIEIISKKECDNGLKFLQEEFNKLFSSPEMVSVVPILRSGLRLGKELIEDLNIEINPMQMSYYKDDTSRLEEPICLLKPSINKILLSNGTIKPIVFAECVVDSQGTVLKAIEEINKMFDNLNIKYKENFNYPEYHTFAYVSKTGSNPVEIPNMTAAFDVHPDIWVGGLGCDLPGDAARELSHLVGILSPFAKDIPQRPYFTPNF